MIAVIDIGMGNLRNVQKAFQKMGYPDVIISNKKDELEKADALIIAGVGAFGDAMENIAKLKLMDTIRTQVLKNNIPIMGICLGFQLLASEGFEGGHHKGLDLLPMSVKKMELNDQKLRLPHIGWDDTQIAKKDSILFKDIPDDTDFYYVHSFAPVCEKDEFIASTCNYGGKFASAVEYKNIFGTQFHPEKSHKYGLRIIKNFADHIKSLNK